MSPTPYRNSTSLGLPETLERVLAYALFWFSGLILFFIEKNPTVRRHAMQSMLVFGPLFLVFWLVEFVHALIGWVWIIGGIVFAVQNLLWGLIILAWVGLMIMAAISPGFSLPGVGKARRYLQ